jgi:hypothetical protein
VGPVSSVATLSMLLPRDPRPAWELARGGFILSTTILIAALLNLAAFDFVAPPGAPVYIGAYAIASPHRVHSDSMIDHRSQTGPWTGVNGFSGT